MFVGPTSPMGPWEVSSTWPPHCYTSGANTTLLKPASASRRRRHVVEHSEFCVEGTCCSAIHRHAARGVWLCVCVVLTGHFSVSRLRLTKLKKTLLGGISNYRPIVSFPAEHVNIHE